MDWDSFRADMLISRIQYWDDLVERWISVLKGRFIGGLCPAAWNHQHGYCCPSGAHQVDGCFDMHLSLLNPPLKVADDTLFMIFRLILLTSNSLHIPSSFHFYHCSRCPPWNGPGPAGPAGPAGCGLKRLSACRLSKRFFKRVTWELGATCDAICG